MIKRLIQKLKNWGNGFSIGNRARTLWQELRAQMIEQPAHFLMGLLFPLMLAFPDVVGCVIAIGWACFIVLREWEQWPSSRWYDPWLDGLFLAGGTGAGFIYLF